MDDAGGVRGRRPEMTDMMRVPGGAGPIPSASSLFDVGGIS
jgi:hypothetical protein